MKDSELPLVSGDGITVEFIREHLRFLWDEYACEDDENMTEDARELASSVRRLVEEVKTWNLPLTRRE